MTKEIETSKILAITDANGEKHEFISETEEEVSSAKLTYYMWLS